jgi:hypothetical protein
MAKNAKNQAVAKMKNAAISAATNALSITNVATNAKLAKKNHVAKKIPQHA